jgi:hypothetical protein
MMEKGSISARNHERTSTNANQVQVGLCSQIQNLKRNAQAAKVDSEL